MTTALQARGKAMRPQREANELSDFERDREAWNLPPVKRPQVPQPQSSVQSGREDKREAEQQAA
jgi:hypothetical protein